MSGRKSNLSTYQIITAGDMSQTSVTSQVTNIQWLDNIGVQLDWTGSPSGNFAIQISMDYQQDTLGNVLNAGTWAALTLSPSPSTDGGSPIYIDINQLSAPWIRTVYTNIGIGSGDIATVADVAGSLNSKYFLLNGSDGDNWYVWFTDGAGVDPAIADRTGIAVTFLTGDSANAIATAMRSTMTAITSIQNISGSTNHVTFLQTEVGPGSLTQGTASTGFTLGYTGYTGTLTGYICGKMV